MPYCCQCGKATGDADVFCAVCGARQPLRPPREDGITPHTAAILCYIPVLGWIPAVIALASGRYRQEKTLRFHAFQGIYLFVAWLMVDWVLGPMPGFRFPLNHGLHFFFFGLPALSLGVALKALVLFAWIFMLVKTSQGELIKLPVLGELADRSVAEQR